MAEPSTDELVVRFVRFMAGPGVCWALAASQIGIIYPFRANFNNTAKESAQLWKKKHPKRWLNLPSTPCIPCISNSESLFVVCVFLCRFCRTCRCAFPSICLFGCWKKVERSSSNSKESLLTNQCSAVPTLWKVLVPCWSTFVLPGSCTKNSVPKPIHLLNRLAQPILSGTSYTYTWHIMALLRC